jgi:hypothetical protein
MVNNKSNFNAGICNSKNKESGECENTHQLKPMTNEKIPPGAHTVEISRLLTSQRQTTEYHIVIYDICIHEYDNISRRETNTPELMPEFTAQFIALYGKLNKRGDVRKKGH